jgi:hypothetical protein
VKVEKLAKNGEKGQNSQPLSPGAGTWAGARIEDSIHNLNYVDPEENSTAQAREYLSQAQLVVSKREN